MKTLNVLLSIALVLAVFVTQVGTVFAAPAIDKSVSGSVTAVACQTDQVTGDKTFLVTVQPPHGPSQVVRVDQATAEALGLVELDGDGNPDCGPEALAKAVGVEVTIDSTDILPNTEEAQHPVGAALATFFEEITNYDSIMQAHEDGYGFGLIAQALWLTQKLGGNTDIFLAILQAKKSGDYSSFTFADGTPVPENWGQFRKLILDGDKQHGLGSVMFDKNKEHGNNGDGGGNGQGNGNPDKNNDHTNRGKNEDRGNGKHR